MFGDVARQHTRPGHLVALDDGVDHAVVVTPGAVLKVGLDHSRPVALFQKPRQVSGRLRMQRRGQKFFQFMANQFGTRNAENFRGPPVHRF